jgi:hypothetical protein
MATLRQQLLDLIDKLSPDVEQAFLEAIADIRSEIVLREIVEKLERHDVEGAINALHIEQSAFRPLTEALRIAFNQGGVLTIGNIPRLSDPLGGRVVLRWDGDTQRAQAIIREQSSMLVSGITEGVREQVRETIVGGFSQGRGSKSIALDIVGRQNRVTLRRENGLLGLTPQLARTVESARIALLTGDIEGMKHYLTLTRRNKSHDRTVLKAIREGKPVDPVTVGKMTGKLADSYLALRGLLIARTETAKSVNSAQHEAYWQGLDSAGRDASLVTRTWRSAGDRRVRHTHAALNAKAITGMDLPFQSPSGAMMRFPGDSSLGAGPGELIGCRCICQYSFDFAEAYARSRGR